MTPKTALLLPWRPSVPQVLRRRSFFSLPENELQSLNATRILPYKADSLYNLIADIDSYSTFVPYCLGSKITEWSQPNAEGGKRWPQKADLTIGWGKLQETFTSSLHCTPNTVLEALSGEPSALFPGSALEDHTKLSDSQRQAQGTDIFTSLSTKWVLKPFHYKPPTGRPQTDMTTHPAQDQTEVHLLIRVQFANPFYANLSKAVTPKMAELMIEAFEARARRILDRPDSGLSAQKMMGASPEL